MNSVFIPSLGHRTHTYFAKHDQRTREKFTFGNSVKNKKLLAEKSAIYVV